MLLLGQISLTEERYAGMLALENQMEQYVHPFGFSRLMLWCVAAIQDITQDCISDHGVQKGIEEAGLGFSHVQAQALEKLGRVW